jgi:hypothetical protein
MPEGTWHDKTVLGVEIDIVEVVRLARRVESPLEHQIIGGCVRQGSIRRNADQDDGENQKQRKVSLHIIPP